MSEALTISLQAESLAREMIAFSNSYDGTIVLGVDDEGNIVGVDGDKNYEEWVVNIARNNVIPPIHVSCHWVQSQVPGKEVLLVEVPKGKDRPYQDSSGRFYVRVGSTNRIASLPELMRLFQQGGFYHYDGTEVEGALETSLNPTALERYFHSYDVQYMEMDRAEQCSLLKNTDILSEQVHYPDRVFRELIVNACVHRNYSIQGSRIRIFMFDDRLEFISPGRLPNRITTDKLKSGVSYAVNPVIVKFMENLRYMDKLGRGLPLVYREAVKQGKRVIFEEIGEEFKVSLFL